MSNNTGRRFSIVLTCLTLLAVSAIATAKHLDPRTAPPGSQNFDNGTYLDAARTLTFVTNYGVLARDVSDVFGYNYGCFYPFSSVADIEDGANVTSPVFSAGLWIGGKVSGEVRVSVADYTSEFTPGPISGGTFLPGAATDPAYRTYKLFADSGVTNPNQDYLDWPIAEGAPVDGLNRPLITGTQSLWAVFNDMDTARHTMSNGGSVPMGIEVQQYVFARDASPEQSSAYFRFTLHNRNTHTIDSCFVGLFIDPDLGDAQDDMIGSDSAGQFVYCYNATNNDMKYGSSPPAVGFQLLNGPVVPSPGETADFHGSPLANYRNLPAYALMQYATGADPSTPDSTYNTLKGLSMDGSPMVNPLTSDTTRFVFSGNPVTATGWLQSTPSDRAVLVSSGPFTFAPGDSQCFFVRMVIRKGADRLSSVSLLRSAMNTPPNVPTGVEDNNPSLLPDRLTLDQNYPNPFNPTTTIHYSLPHQSQVLLEVVNVLGQRVRTIVDEVKPAGDYRADWNGLSEAGAPVASGVYFYRLRTDDNVLAKKMLLVK